MPRIFRIACVLLAFALAACAQAPSKPQAAAAQVPQLSAEDRVAFFIQHARGGETAAVLKELDAGGIDINAFDALSQTALIAAVSHNHATLTQLLLDRGADPNLADPAGWTPLIHAIYSGAGPALLQRLLDGGADINARNDRGITALYLASGTGREDQVQFLLAHGADPKQVSTSGYTAVRIAQLKGLDRIVALLEGRTPPPAAPRAAAAQH